jgi:hypothetical protein
MHVFFSTNRNHAKSTEASAEERVRDTYSTSSNDFDKKSYLSAFTQMR